MISTLASVLTSDPPPPGSIMPLETQKYAKNELKECTFSPALISKSISSKAKTGELPGDGGKAEPVYERLYTPRGRSRVRFWNPPQAFYLFNAFFFPA